MAWIERPLLQRRLRAALGVPGPAVVTVAGAPGMGVSGLLRRVLPQAADRIIAFTASDAPPPRRLERAVEAWLRAGVPLVAPAPGGGGSNPDSPPSWTGLVASLLESMRAHRRSLHLVVDDAPELLAGDGAEAAALAALWASARSHALPLHLILAGHDDDRVERWIDEALPGAGRERVRVPPVRMDELRAHLPDWLPEERHLIRAALGGRVATLGMIDPGLRATTNLFRLVVDPQGPLHAEPPRRLREDFQKPARYAGILGALADGAREWAGIRKRNPAFRSGNQLAPYLAALQERGWVRAERSLDAAPSSRGRRYHLADPSVAFWYAVAEPARDRLLAGEAPGRVARELALGPHLARTFPHLCRKALLEGVADARLPLPHPLRAREMGGLWGPDHELPISGTLRSGAIVHGVGVWGRVAGEADARAALAAQGLTRYGFGRESRFVLIVTSRGASDGLARWGARDHRLILLPMQSLF